MLENTEGCNQKGQSKETDKTSFIYDNRNEHHNTELGTMHTEAHYQNRDINN